MNSGEAAQFKIEAIGEIITPYAEKFAIPHQAQAVKEVEGYIRLFSKYADESAIRGLEGFSHLWLIWLFSEIEEGYFSPMVRPPRLGGNKKVGVFASRSPFRPNRLGLSLVKLNEIKKIDGETRILISGVDMLSRTPLIDIKPYVPFDLAEEPCFSWAEGKKAEKLEVVFECGADKGLSPKLRADIISSLEADPRPAYKKQDSEKIFGCLIDGHNVKFKLFDGKFLVLEVENIGNC